MTRSDGHAQPRSVGRYVLHGELASGGMATVHFGRLEGPVGFSRTVAIKRLHPHFAKDPDFVSMFLDEARLCGRIRHPNVVPTLDVVTTEGEIFIVMEYVAGEAFSKLLKTAWDTHTPVPPRVAAAIVASVLHGLHAAHQTKDEHGRELGIVHRDVSPQNILVGTDGSTRVLDFGIAKAAGRMQTTRDGQVKGKIAYMPPEQLSGGSVTRQSDIYAAAVVLWEALTARRLFDGETEAIVLVRAIEGKIEPPSHFSPAIDTAADGVVLRGLTRDPKARFETAREMALAIEQTIGLASPYEVGEWVERGAAGDIAQRAQRIAAIESASMVKSTSEVRTPAPSLAEIPHSQISSISVARPANVTPAPLPRRERIAWLVGSVGGLLAIVGLVLGGLALLETEAAAHAEAPHEMTHERRSLFVLKPPTGAAKAPLVNSESLVTEGLSTAGSATAFPPALVTPPPPPRAAVAPAPNVAPPPKPAKPVLSCDPPYTLDTTTGRKKYKIECLK